jgi:uncharacterized protein DUF262
VSAPTPFEISTQTLGQLLAGLHDGTIQVPEFQREMISDDDGIKLLLASVSLSYPIGAVKLLEAGSSHVRFDARPIAGAPASSTEPDRLLLDGQHRLTVLYQVLASGHVVPTQDEHKKPIRRWYYVDINGALDADSDRDESIISVPESRRTQRAHEIDVSTVEYEWEQCLFPLSLVFGDDAAARRWLRGFADHGTDADAAARATLMQRFESEVLAAFEEYLVPTFVVGKEWTRWAVRVHGGSEGRSLSDRFRIADRGTYRS